MFKFRKVNVGRPATHQQKLWADSLIQLLTRLSLPRITHDPRKKKYLLNFKLRLPSPKLHHASHILQFLHSIESLKLNQVCLRICIRSVAHTFQLHLRVCSSFAFTRPLLHPAPLNSDNALHHRPPSSSFFKFVLPLMRLYYMYVFSLIYYLNPWRTFATRNYLFTYQLLHMNTNPYVK